MPTYCYTTVRKGVTVEVSCPFGEAPKFVRVDVSGEEIGALRDYRAESASVPAASGWPLECVASGVNAEQADDLRAEFKKHGLAVRVSENGNPIYENAAQRKRALKARGFHDRAAWI